MNNLCTYAIGCMNLILPSKFVMGGELSWLLIDVIGSSTICILICATVVSTIGNVDSLLFTIYFVEVVPANKNHVVHLTTHLALRVISYVGATSTMAGVKFVVAMTMIATITIARS